MDSLYGDLPPPVSNKGNKIGKNNDKNGSSEANKDNFIEINKFLITPAIIQKKIANIKNVNKEMDSDQNDRKDEAEKYHKHNHMNAAEDSCDSDIYMDRDVERIEEKAISHGEKNTPNGEKTQEKDDTHIEKIININKLVQDDLKKISDRLHKIQQSNNRPEQNTSTNHLNGQVISAKVEKIKNIEMNIKKAKLQDNISGSNRNNTGAGEITTPPTEYFQTELYEKYFIANANEDYDPNKPNDLNKIIKERKRKKIIMLAAQKKKLEEERQLEEENKMDTKNGHKKYDPKQNYYGYDKPNAVTAKAKFPFESNRNNMSYTNSGMALLHDEETERNRGNLYNHYDVNGRNFTASAEYNPRERSEWDAPSYDDKEYGKDKKTSDKFYENVNRTKISDPSNDDYKMKNKEVANDTSGEVAAPVKKDFATRMMEKMGWKKGEGLGKDKQGITAPLILQKVDKRSGVIVQAPDILKKHKSSDGHNENNDDGNSFAKSNANLSHSNHALSNNTSRIIRLSNLVTKDEVDDTLKEEIEEEASKFGNLLNINIAIDKNLSDAHAVKIFCEYESKDQAQNALNTFKGRTFAGRKVEAIFATEEEYLSYGRAP
ncbi:RNA-binding protein, putative [Plasmodium knowlesi strain H]|uniref:RNA-binding protein, putative n=3 Tax=Plasmodium knowlesi TaxID=5850 RepID=A0A5K1VKW2_PLAKH|nr:RNA-binding protein, putative [Plasmodium knowlesi strain H]OTN65314.1 putative RNA binding protein [Plasmodium knowlesi]CAA9989609.1 RNA-binding protein, putative [Plasmodium knowlesi strain H]SBO22682.1 RNA-binding protein, putative [Plasmodium knowlesi strain H]SBO23288.1 RNA-binding protein, putative [Plasmodium knowlesi strain H]VVS79083.1 RNA-binding protein, putative [Plasmodium knowlesi strain H]|eukprot:XP_002260335.1 RNA binding protein, putative [Plasmodium knowlesi strain H]